MHCARPSEGQELRDTVEPAEVGLFAAAIKASNLPAEAITAWARQVHAQLTQP